MSYIPSNESGILVPAGTTSAPPKIVSRRDALSAMGGLGAGFMLPASVGGLGLMASGAANAAVTPVGTKQFYKEQSSRVISPGVTEKIGVECWYRPRNSAGQKEVNGYSVRRVYYANPPASTNAYTYAGRCVENAGSLIIFDEWGNNDGSIPTSSLSTTGPGTCRRLNPSAIENLGTAYPAPTGFDIIAIEPCKRLGDAASAFAYIKYRNRSNGYVSYRFLQRVGATGGLLVTSIIAFTGGIDSDVIAITGILQGFAQVEAISNTISISGLTAVATTAVGVAIASFNSFDATAMLAASAAVLAAILAYGGGSASYFNLATTYTNIRLYMARWGNTAVPDGVDCR